jgi:exonuclease III
MQTATLNCKGFSRTKHGIYEFLKKENIDILAVQETWLAKQELCQLNISSSYCTFGAAKTDYEAGFTCGRNSGGVAFIWHNALHEKYFVKPVDLNEHWIIGLELIRKSDNIRYMFYNAYFPYRCDDNKDPYIACVSRLQQIVDDVNTTNILICGDFNCDPRNDDFFGKALASLCGDTKLLLSDQLLLPGDTFTYISDCWDSTSWLDHYLCSNDVHNLIKNMSVEYGLTWSDHRPIITTFDLTASPTCSSYTQEGAFHSKLNWDAPGVKEDYYATSDALLANVSLNEAVFCYDPM